MYKIIVCEDELLQLHQITTLINNYILFHNENFELGLSTQMPYECLEYVNRFHVKNGIYLLDINLNSDINGIDLAEKLRMMDSQARIIFVTTHDEMAPITFRKRVEALGFIAKDQVLEAFRDEIYLTLDLAKERSVDLNKLKSKNFAYTQGGQVINIDIDDVFLLQASSIPHRINIFTCKSNEELLGSLSEFQKKYPQLFRCSKSALINIENISRYDVGRKIIYFEREQLQNLSCKCSITKSRELKRKLKI